MIITINLVTIYHFLQIKNFKNRKNNFPCDENSYYLLFQILSITYSSVDIKNAIHYISRTYLSYNWKFVAFDHLHPNPPPPTPCSDNHKSHLFFCESVCLWSIIGLQCWISSCYQIVIWYFFTFQNDHHCMSS